MIVAISIYLFAAISHGTILFTVLRNDFIIESFKDYALVALVCLFWPFYPLIAAGYALNKLMRDKGWINE